MKGKMQPHGKKFPAVRKEACVLMDLKETLCCMKGNIQPHGKTLPLQESGPPLCTNAHLNLVSAAISTASIS